MVEAGVIAAIGKALEVPPNTEILDVTGAAVVPGLVDLHVHFGAVVAANMEQPLADVQAEYQALRPGVRRALLNAGVTTVRSVGDLLPMTLELAQRTAAREAVGPRVYCCGPTFTVPGGHPASTLYRGSEFHLRHGTRMPSDTAEARAMVQALASAGVRGVKAVYRGTATEFGGRRRRSTEVNRWLGSHRDRAQSRPPIAVICTCSCRAVGPAEDPNVDCCTTWLTEKTSSEILRFADPNSLRC